ncbi:MAG: UbiX family flavin prenyltransferase [Sphingobium sp.]
MSLPVIIGISGASGALYGVRLLETLARLGRETFLVVSKAGQRTIEEELDIDIKEIRAFATRWFPIADIGASIASGSVRTAGMIVAPCSIRTAAEIATGNTSSLLTRAADVVLKVRRRLVLMVRETPLRTGHLRILTQLSEMNAIICAAGTGFLFPAPVAGRHGQPQRRPRA